QQGDSHFRRLPLAFGEPQPSPFLPAGES
ncbi:hypothetical protein, partial [Pseudomonas aeruginosa]